MNIKVKNLKIYNLESKENDNKIFFKNLIIKKGNKKYKIDKITKLKNDLSKSEYELFILLILILNFYNLEKNLILDDPIEFSS
jgi:hypothetical protein